MKHGILQRIQVVIFVNVLRPDNEAIAGIGGVVHIAEPHAVELIEDEVAPEVYGILFHPDLIRGTSLGKSIKTYTFFSLSLIHIS